MQKFILADNQDITKAGLYLFIQNNKLAEHIVEVQCKDELIKSMCNTDDVIVVMDYTLFDFTSAEELLILHERFPKTRWVLFSDELNASFLKTILYGSESFSVVMKDSPKDEIIWALHCASRKERFICNFATSLVLSAGKMQTATTNEYSLTETERAILKEIALGKTTKEIAAEKFLSFHTINTHRKNIFRKINVNNVHEATKYAMRAGIIDLAEYCI